jgi:hypothetical protein
MVVEDSTDVGRRTSAFVAASVFSGASSSDSSSHPTSSSAVAAPEASLSVWKARSERLSTYP